MRFRLSDLLMTTLVVAAYAAMWRSGLLDATRNNTPQEATLALRVAGLFVVVFLPVLAGLFYGFSLYARHRAGRFICWLDVVRSRRFDYAFHTSVLFATLLLLSLSPLVEEHASGFHPLLVLTIPLLLHPIPLLPKNLASPSAHAFGIAHSGTFLTWGSWAFTLREESNGRLEFCPNGLRINGVRTFVPEDAREEVLRLYNASKHSPAIDP